MKRKLALFMATMMTLSLLPMNVFAATTNSLSGSVSAVPENTVMVESGVMTGTSTGLTEYLDNSNDDAEWYIEGNDLVMKVTDSVKAGDQATISLTNAEFFFRGSASTYTARIGSHPWNNGSTANTSASALVAFYTGADTSLTAAQQASLSSMINKYNVNLAGFDANPGRADYTEDWNVNVASTAPIYTYDVTKGVWIPTTAYDGSGSYYRFSGRHEATGRVGVPYKLEIARGYASNQATLTILPSKLSYVETYDNASAVEHSYTEGWEIRVPLVTLTSDEKDVKVYVSGNSVTTGTWLFGMTSGNATKTEVTDPQTARDEFDVLDDLLITETRLGSIRTGQVYIKLPTGFEWELDNTVAVGVTPGVSWGNTSTSALLRQGSTSSYYSNTYNAAAPSYIGTSSYSGTAISDIYSNTINAANNTYWNPGTTTSGWSGDGVPYNSGNTTAQTVHQVASPSVAGAIYSVLASAYDSTTGYAGVLDDYMNATFFGTPSLPGTTTGWYVVSTSSTTGSSSTNGFDYAINYKNPGSSSEDRTTLVLTLNGINRSDKILGSVYIRNLKFNALENAPYGPINAEISNVDSNTEVVTNQTFLAGTRVDWTISLKALGTIPELVNGRYDAEEPWNASDTAHKTAKVQFKENTTAAWWAQRQTVFSLPEGVKFRKVQITEVKEMDGGTTNYKDKLKNDSYSSSYYGYQTGGGIYVNDGEKHGYVTVDGNTMTFNNLKVDTDEKATIEFDCWVSIESGFQGDVTMSVSGSAIPEQPGTVPAVVIAKQISPISISTKITDVKIGYQYVSTASIEITETRAGILEKGKDVRVSVTDLVSTDLYFSSDTKVAVKNAGETGALKIKDVQNVAAGSSTVYGLAVNGGTIKFVVDAASSKASTIVISDVAVKVDRTVPETNKYPYKVVVWGKAIANNYQYINDSEHYRYPITASNTSYGTNYAKDLFGTAGIEADYIRIVSSANDKANVLYAEVKVTIGEKYYTVNGKQADMDAAAYISTASNSTMVPLRFVSNALGISDEGVIWDDTNRTVTIISPDGKIAQFKIGDSTMTLNGTAITMMSPDGLPVVAEIVGDRSYVPFRALGDAFAIPVTWEEDTQSAVYNKGAATGATEATTVAATTESTR